MYNYGFKYKALGITASMYVAKLQEHSKDMERYADELLEENEQQRQTILKLERQLARSGNDCYKRDADQMGQQWQDLNLQHGALVAEHAKAMATLKEEYTDKILELKQLHADALNDLSGKLRRTEIERDFYEEQAEDYKAQLETYRLASIPVKHEDQPRKQSGQFVSDDGMTKKQKQEKAYHLSQDKDITLAEIAREIGCTAETARRYINDYAHEMEKEKALSAAKAEARKYTASIYCT